MTDEQIKETITKHFKVNQDLLELLRVAEAQNAEINEWKNQAERERMAAEARCNEYVAQNMRQAQRLAALERAALEALDWYGDAFPWPFKRLAEVLQGKY